MKDFKNRVAVITGAAGGLGGALAMELAQEGCHLALVDVNAERVKEIARHCGAHGVRVSQHVTDVTSAQQMEELPGEVIAEHGGVNLLINNAGITLQKNFITHSLEDWERIMGINFWGVLYGCKFFYDELLRADEAHIVNLSSMSSFVGLPGQSSYCATKAAVQGLSESLWAELALDGIGVTSAHPGAIRTDMIQATLKDSDDVKAAQRNYELAQKLGVEPAAAAKKILTAVRKGHMRVRVGRDAVILDVLKRLLPRAAHKPMISIAKQQRKEAGASS